MIKILMMILLSSVLTFPKVVHQTINKYVPQNGHSVFTLQGRVVLDLDSTIGQVIEQCGDNDYWRLESDTDVVSLDTDALAMKRGDIIDGEDNFSSSQLLYYSDGNCGPAVEGEFYNVPDRYLGFRFDLEDGTHYGWIHITNAAWVGREIYTYSFITDWAYEDSPYTMIKAGL